MASGPYPQREQLFPGNESVPPGTCVQVDRVVDYFLVTTESLAGLSPETVRDQIQKQLKVLGITHTRQITYCRQPPGDRSSS